MTAKKRAFIEHYLRCWNATEAARRAGYCQKHANRCASRLLHDPDVLALKEARIAEIAMGADEVLLRLAEQARADMGDFLRGEVITEIDIPSARAAHKTHLLKRYSKSRDGVETIELYDAQEALIQLGKHLGLFKDAGVTVNLPPVTYVEVERPSE